MNQKIIIRNFGPLKEIDLEITDYLFLIGEQASGKSTIAKLVYFFKSLRNDLIDYLFEDEGIDNVNRFLTLKIRKKFLDFFDIGHSPDVYPFFIKYRYAKGRYIEIFHRDSTYADARLSDFEEIGNSNGVNTEKELIRVYDKIQDFRENFLGVKKDFESYSDSKQFDFDRRQQLKLVELEINNFFGDDKDSFFIPAGRSILATLADQLQTFDMHNLDFLMRAFILRIQRLKKVFDVPLESIIQQKEDMGEKLPQKKQLDIAVESINSILKGRYHADKNGEKIFYDDDNFVKLNFASSGQQEIVWILLQLFSLILNKEKTFLVIEEPEAHLYPVAQKQVCELVTLFTKITESQLIVTTHSPYILASFNNLIYANNVGKSKPNEAAETVNPEFWIDYDRLSAYKIANGKATLINDTELQLIKVEEIDKASELINADFDKLFNLEE